MRKYVFFLAVSGLFLLVAAAVPTHSLELPIVSQQIYPSDSTELQKHNIYICKGHFFEWCTEPSTCAHCNENLEKVNLWEYYKLLECEDCQKFFEENYPKFINHQPEI